MEVGGSDESLKCWIFENGLEQDSSFREKLGRKESNSLKELMYKVQRFINME